MRIADVDLERQLLVVAEIGNNHEGDFDQARRLIDAAGTAGADAVKFQTFRTEHYVSRQDPHRFAQLKAFELNAGQFERLSEHARSAGMLFVSTPFDLGSVAVLRPLVAAYKIASGDNDFYPLLQAVARTAKPVMLSAGLADVPQLRRALECIRDGWRRGAAAGEVAVLHCVTAYPVPPEQANLAAIRHLATALACTVGYSDHTLGVEACVFAAALGARIIEKHFTLDKNASAFRDHRLSADPGEFRALTRRVREAASLLGSGDKVIQPCEQAALPGLRRSIVAACDLAAGAIIGLEHLTWVRPGGGLAPGREAELLGGTLAVAVRQGERLTPDQLQRDGAGS